MAAASSLDSLRQQVRQALAEAPAAQSLSADKRNELAHNLVKVLGALGDGPPLAQAQADAPAPQKASITGAAIDKVGDSFGALVEKVDFPKFVSGLIEGVFTSIVDSSIRQMEAYGELVAAVAKSVDQFAEENFTEDDGRQFLLRSFPQGLEMDGRGGRGRLRLRESTEDRSPPDLAGFLGVESVDLDDEKGESAAVAAAKRKMAEGRQKQLATMVLMGINRIVVTDGKINAKVMFDVKGKETADFSARANNKVEDTQSSSTHSSGRSGNIWGTSRHSNSNSSVSTTVSTTDASASQKSHEEIQSRAQLSGEVTVNFRSETFPLEKIASLDQMGAIQTRSNAGGAGGGGGAR